MRTCEQVKLVPGGRSGSSHDRASLYVKRRAAGFVDRVCPLNGGYTSVAVTLERPFSQDGRIVGFIDLMITAVPVEYNKERRESQVRYGLTQTADLRDVFFVEVKPARDSIGGLLRQFQMYQHSWDREDFARRFAEYSPEEKALGLVPTDDGWPFRNVHWVLATVYKPSLDERQMLRDIGVLITELDGQRVDHG